jgi:GNAT superfamily N-acetyltransferase
MKLRNLKTDFKFHAQFLQVIEMSLHYPMNFSYAKDFMLLVGEHNWHRCYFLEIDGVVLSTAAVYERELFSGEKIFLVGAVATHPLHRGKGYSKKILSALHEEFNPVMLWSDQEEFYFKLGYKKFGRAQLYHGSGAHKWVASCKLIDTPQAFKTKVESLFDESKQLFKREKSDWDKFWSLSTIELLWKESGDTLEAYALVGKGADMQGFIHEWSSGCEDWLKQLTILGYSFVGDLSWLSQQKFEIQELPLCYVRGNLVDHQRMISGADSV